MRSRLTLILLAFVFVFSGAVAAPAQPATAAEPGTSAVYRMWSPEFRGHFYTMSVAERDHIIDTYPDSTWTYEGAAYSAYASQVSGTVPLYRFWSAEFRGHFFTTNEDEKNQVIANYSDSTWLFEGVAFYVYPSNSAVSDTNAVARFWSPTFRHHFYTANADEANLVRNTYTPDVWTYENDSFRVPSTTPTAAPVPVRFADSIYAVDVDIPAGVYRTDGSDGCYWERTSGFGGTFDEIIANSYSSAGPQLVELLGSDAGFESSGCGGWYSIGLHKPANPVGDFGDGMWRVGSDILAGTYRSNSTDACYWERLRALTGEGKDIIANSYSAAGQQIIQVSAGDLAISSSGCGTWSRVG
jgi:hypothetical protein